MDKNLFEILINELEASVDSNFLIEKLSEEYKAFNICIKTRAGDNYKIAKRKITNSGDVVETAIYQKLDAALLIAGVRHAAVIPYEEIAEISAEAVKGYER